MHSKMHSQSGLKTPQRRLFSLWVDDSVERAVPGVSSWLMSGVGSAVPIWFSMFSSVCPSRYIIDTHGSLGRALYRPKSVDLVAVTQLSMAKCWH